MLNMLWKQRFDEWSELTKKRYFGRQSNSKLHAKDCKNTGQNMQTDMKEDKCHNLPCNFFKTATSIFKTCFCCWADSNFMATCSRVTRSKASYISPKPPPPIRLTTRHRSVQTQVISNVTKHQDSSYLWRHGLLAEGLLVHSTLDCSRFPSWLEADD